MAHINGRRGGGPFRVARNLGVSMKIIGLGIWKEKKKRERGGGGPNIQKGPGRFQKGKHHVVGKRREGEKDISEKYISLGSPEERGEKINQRREGNLHSSIKLDFSEGGKEKKGKEIVSRDESSSRRLASPVARRGGKNERTEKDLLLTSRTKKTTNNTNKKEGERYGINVRWDEIRGKKKGGNPTKKGRIHLLSIKRGNGGDAFC